MEKGKRMRCSFFHNLDLTSFLNFAERRTTAKITTGVSRSGHFLCSCFQIENPRLIA